MPLTPEEQSELAYLKSLVGDYGAPQAEPQQPVNNEGFTSRFLKGLANAPGEVVSGLAQFGNRLFSNGEAANAGELTVPNVFDLAPAETWQQKAADIGSGIVSTVAQAYLPASAISRGASALGAGARTASLLGNIGSGAYLGAQHSPEEAAIQGAEFGAMDAIGAMVPGGNVGKRLLRGVLNAAVPMGSAVVRGQDPFSKENLINSGTQGILGAAFHSKNPNEKQLIRREQSPTVPSDLSTPSGLRLADDFRVEKSLSDRILELREVMNDPSITPEAKAVARQYYDDLSTVWAKENGGGHKPSELRLVEDVAPPRAVEQVPATVEPIPSTDPRRLFPAENGPITDAAYGRELDVYDAFAGIKKGIPTPDVAPLETGKQLRSRLSERGSVDPVVLQQIAGTLAGGATGYANAKEDEKLQGTLIGALGGAILPGATRQLLRTVKNPAAAIADARKQRILPESMKKVFPKTEAKLEQAARNEANGKSTPLGKFARFMERDVIGSGDDVMRAKEVSEGFQNLSAQTAKEAISKLKTFHKTATPKERAAVEAFFNDKAVGGTWSPAAEAKLRAEVGNANAEQFMAMRDVQQKLQAEIGKAIPEKDPMIQATMGTHTSNSFRAFTDPKQWTKDLAANPKISTDAVDHMMKQPQFANWEREAVEIALGEYKADVLRKSKGEIFTPSAGSAKVESTLFTKRKSLPNEFRALLGEIKDPFERQALTIAKLVKSAAKAKAINEFAALRDASGVKMTLKPDEFNAALAKAKASGDAAMLKKLSAYQQIPDATMFGKVGGSFAPREVIDALNAHNEALRAGGEGLLAGLNTFLKKSLTSRNPASHIHQWMQIAPQALILRVYNTKTFIDAAKALYKKGDVFRELVRVGAVGADFSSAELGRGVKNLDQMFGGPKGILGRLRQADDIASKAFGVPDNIVRAAGYLANKGRFLEQGIKDGLTGAALQKYAEDATMKFVNRYSINFNHVPNVVKKLRNVPGISPFVSFSSQMAGILKNLGEDVIHGSAKDKAWALANLAQLGALPLMASAIMEGQLSEKDREEWLKAQKLSPDYAKSQIRVPLGREKNGAFRYMSLNSFTPAGDFVSMARNLARGDVHSLVTENPVIGLTKTPLLNLATTLIGGEDPFTKEKVQTAGEITSRVAQALLPPWTPVVGGTGKRMVPSFTPNEEGGLGVENPRTGRRDTPGDWARGVLGLQTSAVQPKQLLRNVKADARDQILEEQTKFRRVMSTNAAQSVKDKAREKFIMRRKEIMEETKAKLQ